MAELTAGRTPSNRGFPAVRRFLRRLVVRHPVAFGGLLIILAYVAVALVAPTLAPFKPDQFSLSARLKPPVGFTGASPKHLLGTDTLGQDMLSRVIYGARISIAVGVFSVAISATIGTFMGIIAGYFGGRLDQVLSRLGDLLMAFPYLLFAILMMGVLGPGLVNLILALTFKAWVEFFRLARGEMLSERQKEYVEAARAAGCTHARIMFRHILPNIIHTMLVLATLRVGYMMIMEASLSFLGLGVPSDVPAWGSMVAAGREQMLDAWWVSTIPGVAIVLLVLSINAFGEGLRDLLDPRMRGA